MARPQKKSLNYFPLDCDSDDSLKYLKAKYGIIAFAVVVELWKRIYSTEGYYCCFDEKTKFIFSTENKIEIALLDEILQSCFSENIFSGELYGKFQILTSRSVQEKYFKIMREIKRTCLEADPKFLLLDYSGDNSGGNPGFSGVSSGKNPGFYRKNPEEIKEDGKNNIPEETRKKPAFFGDITGGNPGFSGKLPEETPVFTGRNPEEMRQSNIKDIKNIYLKKENKNKEKKKKGETVEIILTGEEPVTVNKKEKSSAKKEKHDEGKYGRHSYAELAERAKNFGR